MINFIDVHREDYGVEPICRVLPIAPSTYYDHDAKRRDPEKMSERAKQDEMLNQETSASTVHARCGGNCSGRVSPWRVVRWSG